MGLCMATHGNLNNHIGVPVTLMRLESAHRSAVIEMGANRVGDVAELMRLAQPSVGLITNAGAEHLEGFGDLDGVAKGEGETVSCLKPEGTAVINADDAYAGYWRAVSGAKRVVTFGVRAHADFAAKNVIQAIEKGEFATRFTLGLPVGRARRHVEGGRCAQCRQCTGGRRSGRGGRRITRGHRRGIGGLSRGLRPPAAQTGRAR